MFPILQFKPQSVIEQKKKQFGWNSDNFSVFNPFKRKHLSFGVGRLKINEDTIGIQRGGVFPVEDYDKLQEFNSKIRLLKWLGKEEEAFFMQENLNTFLEYRFNDHHPNILGKYAVEAIDASVHHNKVTSAGVVGMVYILAQQTDRYFNWVAMGRGQAPEAIGQKTLLDEELRVSVLTDGSQAARGTVWNHVGNLGYGAISGDYYEFGIFDLPEDIPPTKISRMLARSVMPNKLTHTQNDTFVTASHSMIFEIK